MAQALGRLPYGPGTGKCVETFRFLGGSVRFQKRQHRRTNHGVSERKIKGTDEKLSSKAAGGQGHGHRWSPQYGATTTERETETEKCQQDTQAKATVQIQGEGPRTSAPAVHPETCST